MKKKTAKQPKQSKRATVKDLKPKKDAKGGAEKGGGNDIIVGAGTGYR